MKTTQDDLRDHFRDHPVPAIGTLDAYQWILLISGYTRRRTAQILEVKADPNFPKNSSSCSTSAVGPISQVLCPIHQ